MARFGRCTAQISHLLRRQCYSSDKKNQPVQWLADATTYADVQTAFIDPCTSLPYPEKDLQMLLNDGLKINKRHNGIMKRPRPDQNARALPVKQQVVILIPGQGAQHVGMGRKLLQCPAAMEIYKNASEVLGYDVLKLCLEGPKSKLDQTVYCQPAMLVTCLAAFAKAKAQNDTLTSRITDAAGFSVGEFAAFVLADALSFEDALRLVKIRAEAMHDCSQKVSSGMLTIRVSAASRLDEAMEDAKAYAWEKGEAPVCEIANYLFCGVKVIGASNECMKFLEETQEKYAFQVIKKLRVSGAFHTSIMNDAVGRIREALKEVQFKRPSLNIYSNYTGKRHSSDDKPMREAVAKQLSNPVKWEQILQLLHAKHQDFEFPTYMEIGPGKQLGSMLMRISKKAYSNYINQPA